MYEKCAFEEKHNASILKTINLLIDTFMLILIYKINQNSDMMRFVFAFNFLD